MGSQDDGNRINLRDLFQSTQERMVADLAGIRGAVYHSGTLGDETELAWRRFFTSILPNRYQVADGFVVDADGRRSDQIDLIVFDRQYSPPLFLGNRVQYVPAEAVYAVFEIKQRIDWKNLRLACEKAASVRALRRTSVEITSAEGTLSPKPLHRIITGILAMSNTYIQDFEGVLKRRMSQAPEQQRLDLGCAVKDGSFMVKYQESGGPGSIEVYPGELSLVSFIFRLLSALQAIGTVPAIDYYEYVRQLR